MQLSSLLNIPLCVLNISRCLVYVSIYKWKFIIHALPHFTRTKQLLVAFKMITKQNIHIDNHINMFVHVHESEEFPWEYYKCSNYYACLPVHSKTMRNFLTSQFFLKKVENDSRLLYELKEPKVIDSLSQHIFCN